MPHENAPAFKALFIGCKKITNFTATFHNHHFSIAMNLNYFLLTAAFTAVVASCSGGSGGEAYSPAAENSLRAPAVPLVTIDPYTSAWSFSDNLYDESIRHWSGREFPMIGALRVDGEVYRFMGAEKIDVVPVIGTATSGNWQGVYTFSEPKAQWQTTDFIPAGWKEGKAAFGTEDNPGIGTEWVDGEIWVRRTFEWPDSVDKDKLYLQYSHDDNIEVYLNGIQIAAKGNGLDYDLLAEIPENVAATIRPTGNVLAAYCRNNGGGAYVDMGIMKKVMHDEAFEKKAVQKSCTVMPTQTFYTFECGPVSLDLIFTAPALLDDLEAMSAPYNYISYQVRSLDGKEHETDIYFETSPQWAVNTIEQPVVFDMTEKNGYVYLTTGTETQEVLARKGDDVRIDWGYFYLSAASTPATSVAIDEYYSAKEDFLTDGKLSGNIGQTSPDMISQMTVLAFADNIGKVGAKTESGHILIGYDDIESIQYFGSNRKAYWKHDGQKTIFDAFEQGQKDYKEMMRRCGDFDAELMAEATEAGGRKYAELCALAYRQAVAAHKLVTDDKGELLFFSKENFSNGSIGTVDITYPSAPMFLCYNPELVKGMMNPIFHYSESGQWIKPFLAHDVGTYPLANGQTYNGDMPVEESGNMLILAAALAAVEGNADYALAHWPVLSTWADYLVKEGLDPANQLCTDDFAGHFAHNANLSIKAIMGVAAYAKLADQLGKKDIAEKYMAAARDMASKWQEMAADGDHYRLTFDRPGSWSQKYNMIWDSLLGLDIFPEK